MIEVLFAFDGSESARRALRTAVPLLRDARFVVVVAHAEPISVEQAGAALAALPDAVVRQGVASLEEQILSEGRALADDGTALAQSAGANALPATVAATWAPWRAILEEARRRDSDLVARGTRGLGGFGRAILGSSSSALVHHADRPVLILPVGETPPDGPLLIAYDKSRPARAAIRVAARLFQAA